MNPTDARSPQLEADLWPDLEGFDAAAARQCCGNSVPVFGRLLGLLQKSYGRWQVTWLESAQANAALNTTSPDTTALCASLHKLRGSASTMGAFHLARVAEEAESLLRQRRESPAEAVQRVGAVLDELLGRAQAWQAATQTREEP